MLWIESATDNWLDQEVEFTLLGQKIKGKVVEVLDVICTQKWLIVEFYDGNKQVKVGGSYQSFRKINKT